VALSVGAIVFVVGFVAITRLGVVPVFMHDDYEYTYPSFNLVRVGEFGSPLMGTGLNVEHRTYNFTMYYYATVHAALIRIYGDRPESMPLANLLHCSLLIACAIAYCIYRGQIVMGLVFVIAFLSDRLVTAAALAGRPEMTAAFGYFIALLALYEWQVWHRNPWVLAAASGGAVLAGLTHPAGVIVLIPTFALFIALNFRQLITLPNAAALLAPCAVPVLLYAYFVATDDWRNIVAQMLANSGGNIVWARRRALLEAGQFGALAATAKPVWDHFSNVRFVYAVPGIVAGVAAVAAGDRLGSWREELRAHVIGSVFFSVAFVLAVIMHWLFLKEFVGSYTVIYRCAWYLALAISMSLLVLPIQVWLAARHWTELKVGALALAVALYVTSHDAAAVAARLHGGFKFADYARFRTELNQAMTAAGAHAGDHIYCPSPFGTYLSPEFRPVTYGGERYFAGMWPQSFDIALNGKRAVARESPSFEYLKKIVFLNPKWIVTWDEDYSDLQDYMRFVKSFPNIDPDIRIVEAGNYVSQHTYLGGIHIFRVDLSPMFSNSLDRTLDVARGLARYR
jgi:hypothetical protein